MDAFLEHAGFIEPRLSEVRKVLQQQGLDDLQLLKNSDMDLLIKILVHAPTLILRDVLQITSELKSMKASSKRDRVPSPPKIMETTSSASTIPSISWSCPLCTYNNKSLHLICEMCQTQRPPSPPPDFETTEETAGGQRSSVFSRKRCYSNVGVQGRRSNPINNFQRFYQTSSTTDDTYNSTQAPIRSIQPNHNIAPGDWNMNNGNSPVDEITNSIDVEENETDDLKDPLNDYSADEQMRIERPKLPKTNRTLKSEDWIKNIKLSDEQEEILQMVKDKKNVFITGSGGVGKSVMAKVIMNWMNSANIEYAALAPTGVAALNVNGSTIHSWAGIGVPKYYDDFQRAFDKESKNRIQKVKAIIIDEISMVSGELLDCLETAVAMVRKYNQFSEYRRELKLGNFDDVVMRRHELKSIEPWGGLQVILMGDFFQLPPVAEFHPKDDMLESLGIVKKKKVFKNRGWAFQARAWKYSNFKMKELTKVFRQNEEEFIRILECIRKGKSLTMEQRQIIERIPLKLKDRTDGIKPTTLYCTNSEVERDNIHHLNLLESDPILIHSKDETQMDEDTSKKLENNEGGLRKMEQLLDDLSHLFFRDCRAKDVLELKVGAQVMLLYNLNIEKGLVNGSRGVVIDSIQIKQCVDLLKKYQNKCENSQTAQPQPKENEEEGTQSNEVPQSIEDGNDGIDFCKIDDENDETPDEVETPNEVSEYERTILNTMKLANASEASKKSDILLSKLNALENKFDVLPIVRFTNGLTIVVIPQKFERVIPAVGTFSRLQVPLMLAWSLTVHKSQGLTIDWVEIDCSRSFAEGQIYVALSRCIGKDNLAIRKKGILDYIRTSNIVRRFYEGQEVTHWDTDSIRT